MPREREKSSFPQHFPNSGFLKVPWAGGTPGEGRAQARKAAQAQRRQENGGWVQVSGSARKEGPGAGVARGGGRGTPGLVGPREGSAHSRR